MKGRPTIGVAALACLLAVGCGRQEGEEPRLARGERPQPVDLVLVDGRPDPSVLAERQVLHRANGDEPRTLDPHLAEGVPAAHILRDLFEGLTTEAADGTVVPGAAARWNISRDGLVYTFYLRREATWSNGDPLRAEDFVYSLRRSASPATASNYAQVLLPIENAADVLRGAKPPSALGVEALDEYTLQIRLVSPTPYFLGLLAHNSTYPVHRASVETHGEKFSRPGNLVSNGAFTLTDWQVRSRVELTRNPRYRDAEDVILERVYYYPIEDQSTALKRYRAGELHWTDEVPNNQFGWLQANLPNELVVTPWLGSYFFGYNLTRPPFRDAPRLRTALAMAIDRDILVDKVTQFGEQPAYALVPPGIGAYEPQAPEWAAWTQAEREAEARRLYAAAGYGEDDPLRVEVRYNTSENHKKIALAIASMWKQVLGVRVTLVNEEWKVFLQNREQKSVTEVFRAGWIGDYNDPFTFLELFRTGHGRNDYGYSDPIYDALLEQVATERIPARRRRLMEEAERMLMEDMPIIPVYVYVTKRLVDPRLKGWENNIMDHHRSRDMFLLRTRTPGEAASPAGDDAPGPAAAEGAESAADAAALPDGATDEDGEGTRDDVPVDGQGESRGEDGADDTGQGA